MIIPMNESASAVSVAGSATVRMSPQVAGSYWIVKRMITSITSGPDVAVNLSVYKNVISEATKVDGTSSAGQDSSETDIRLETTDVLIGVYTGVPAGGVCTLIIAGDKETGRR